MPLILIATSVLARETENGKDQTARVLEYPVQPYTSTRNTVIINACAARAAAVPVRSDKCVGSAE